MRILPVALALAACLLFSLSAFVQQSASASAPGRSGGVAGLERLMIALLRNPAWSLGAAVNFAGFLVQAVALHQGSVSVVQPLMPTQLLFAVGFASFRARHWPLSRDVAAGAAICLGIALFLGAERLRHDTQHAPAGRVVVVALCAAAGIAGLLLAAHARTPAAAAALTATAAGFCFATTAVLLKVVADHVAQHGPLALLGLAAFYGMLVSTAVGTVLTQAALAAGPLPWATAAMSIANPVVGYVFACVTFGARPPSPAVTCIAVALLVAGVVGLATSRSAKRWTPAQAEPDYA